MDTQEIALEIPSDLYLDLRLWLAEYLPCHIDQIERLEELRIALATGRLAESIALMHALIEMARYRPDDVPRSNDAVKRRGMQLLPELVAVAQAFGQWTESDQYDADVAWRGASMWVASQTAKDRERAQGVEVA